ncbi:hypothetical protein ES703_29023 [subsurface metagenome]
MKIFKTIFKTAIIVVTALAVTVIFILVITSICAKGCSEAIKLDREKKAYSESPKIKQDEELDDTSLNMSLAYNLYDTLGIKFKVGLILSMNSKDTDRWGLRDLIIHYSVPGKPVNQVIIKKEKATISEVITAIINTETAKADK